METENEIVLHPEELPVPGEVPEQAAPQAATAAPPRPMKFCKYCGQQIAEAAVICPNCGCQVEEIKSSDAPVQPNIVINNSNNNVNTNTNTNVVNGAGIGKPKNKWVAIVLCLLLGIVGGHKFYEGKIGMGIVYIITLGGFFGIGCLIDLIRLLFRPNPYYV